MASGARSPQLSRRQLVAWALIAVGTIYLVLIGGAAYNDQWRVRLTSVVIAGAAVLAWAWLAWRSRDLRPSTAVLPALIAVAASLGTSTLFSRIPRVSAEYLGYAVLLVALYLLLVRILAQPLLRNRLIRLTSALFLVISIAFIALVVAHWLHWWSVLGRVTIPPLRPEFESLTYGNPSAVLTMTVLLAMPTAAAAWESRHRRFVVAGIGLLIALVALLSGSRAGWVALGLTVLIVALAVLRSRRGRASLRTALAKALTTRRARIIAAVLTVGLASVAIALAPALIRRATEGGVDLRSTFSILAIRMFLESPVVGTGLGTWVIQRIHETRSPEVDYYIPHAHNLETQTLAEQGLVGIVAALVLVGCVVWLIRDGLADRERPTRRYMAWASVIGLLYFGLHQLLDFYANMPAALFAAAVPIAYLDATAKRHLSIPGQVPRASVQVIALAAVVLSVLGLAWQEGPAREAAAAVGLANTGAWLAADGPAQAAAAQDPEISTYELTAGLTASHAGDHARAAAAFDRVARRDDLPEAWLDLAAEQVALGQPAGALSSLLESLRLGWQRPAVAMAAGDLALRLGDVPDATRAFSQSIAHTPSLAADPWWQAEPSRASIYPVIVDGALGVAAVGNRWEIALMAGRLDQATILAKDPAAPTDALTLIAAWNGDQHATDEIVASCRAQPLDVIALQWCARIVGHQGDLDAANGFRYLANTIEGGSYAGGAELRVAAIPEIGRSPEGDLANFWGVHTYRRYTPWDILVPTLIHLTVE